MNYTDYEKLIQDAVKNPESAPTILKDALDSLKADFEAFEVQANLVKEKDEKIRTLQDTNMRLFLGQTSTKNEVEVADELEGQALVDEFIRTHSINLKGDF